MDTPNFRVLQSIDFVKGCYIIGRNLVKKPSISIIIGDKPRKLYYRLTVDNARVYHIIHIPAGSNPEDFDSDEAIVVEDRDILAHYHLFLKLWSQSLKDLKEPTDWDLALKETDIEYARQLRLIKITNLGI